MVIFNLGAEYLTQVLSKQMSCCFTVSPSRQADVIQWICAYGVKNNLNVSKVTHFEISFLLHAFAPGIKKTEGFQQKVFWMLQVLCGTIQPKMIVLWHHLALYIHFAQFRKTLPFQKIKSILVK